MKLKQISQFNEVEQSTTLNNTGLFDEQETSLLTFDSIVEYPKDTTFSMNSPRKSKESTISYSKLKELKDLEEDLDKNGPISVQKKLRSIINFDDKKEVTLNLFKFFKERDQSH